MLMAKAGFPWVIIVHGRPASHNASARSKKTWKWKVRHAARRVFSKPLTGDDVRLDITFFTNGLGHTQDADNASKPICDALQGIVYLNDNQVSERQAKRRNLRGSYRVLGADPQIIEALQAGKEFVAIKVDNEGEDIHIL